MKLRDHTYSKLGEPSFLAHPTTNKKFLLFKINFTQASSKPFLSLSNLDWAQAEIFDGFTLSHIALLEFYVKGRGR